MYRYTYGDALKDDVVAPFNLALMDNTLPEADILTEFLQSRVKAWDEENSSTSEGWPLIESGVNVDPLDASTDSAAAVRGISGTAEYTRTAHFKWYPAGERGADRGNDDTASDPAAIEASYATAGCRGQPHSIRQAPGALRIAAGR